MVAMLGLALVLATTTVFATTQSEQVKAGPVCPPDCNGVNPGWSANGSQFVPGHEDKSGQASTGNSVAPGQQAAAFVGNGATYAPSQETKTTYLCDFYSCHT